MKWTSKLRRAIKAGVSEYKGSTFDFTNWFGHTFWGVDNSKLATNETIFSVITRLSNTLASLPLKLYLNYEAVSNANADVLINAPNPSMTSFEFIRNMETIRNERGNAYALIERDIRGQVVQMLPLNPDYVEPVLERETNELWYQVIGDNHTFYVHNLEMIHVKHIVGAGGLKGINPIKVLKNSTDYDKAVREFSLQEMKRARSSFILTYNDNVDLEKRQQVIDNFKDFYAANGGILFNEPGIKIDEMQKKYIAADTFQSERITKSRIANVFNIPVIMLNDTEGQNFASNEQLMRMFVQLTLMPIVRQYEQEFNRKLLTANLRTRGYYFKFNVNSLLRGDMAARTNFYHNGLRDGWLSRDEVRMLEDQAPRGGRADELWISGDMYPLDMDPKDRRITRQTTANTD